MGIRLFVGNLPYSATEAELRALFAEHGSVTDVHIAMDRETGRPRGFGFVSLSTPDEAKKAADALNGHDLGGRAMVVNVARERGAGPPPRSGSGPGGPPRSDTRSRPPRPSGGPPRPQQDGYRPPPGGAPPFEEGTERPVRSRPKRKPNYEKNRGEGRPRHRDEDDSSSKGGNWRQWLDDDD